MLNPMDFYLWLSEEIQTFNWDSKAFGTRFGLVANFVFLLARANAGDAQEAVDDVFGDAPASGWVSLVVSRSDWSPTRAVWTDVADMGAARQANFFQWVLVSVSVLNAFYTMTRSRHYRLFEADVETPGPATPSAQRVRVDSSPSSSTPLRLIHDVLRPETAEQRAHPDKTRDVWEMKVWDPYPATLRMFCLFSPGHVLIHMLFLPLPPLDPRPSVTVFKCILLQVILSAQLLLMHSRFTRQIKDMAIIQKEVMHEYDVKYVHPRLQPVVREVATQVSINDGKIDQEDVSVGAPATVIRRSFRTYPNPNYAKHIDPDGTQFPQSRSTMTPQTRTAMPSGPFTPSRPAGGSGPLSFAAQVQQQRQQSAVRRGLTTTAATTTTTTGAGEPSTPITKPSSTATTSTTPAGTSTGINLPPVPPSAGFGGSLGVYTHMNSPLKRNPGAAGLGDGVNGNGGFSSPRNSREMAALEQRDLAERMIRQSSPVKENRTTTTTTTALDPSAFMHSPEKLARARATRWTQERFPSRRV